MFLQISPTTKIRSAVRSYLLELSLHEDHPAHRAVASTMKMMRLKHEGYAHSPHVHDERVECRLALPS
jgi:hypothetical protein